MAGRISTWVWIVVAIAVVIVLGLLAAAGAGLYFFTRHVETTAATATDAASEFDAVRARFAGREPLIELDSDGRVSRTRKEQAATAQGAQLDALHVLVFDPSDARLVRLRVPFWMVRMGGRSGSIDLDGRKITLEELELTVEDLQRIGPALVIDHRTPRGERILVWTQ